MPKLIEVALFLLQLKQSRRSLGVKKTSFHSLNKSKPLVEGNPNLHSRKSALQNTAVTEAFANLSISKRDKTKDKKNSKRNISNETSNPDSRKKKPDPLEHVAKLITSGKAKNVIIMAGAGISTGSGIPDFRTPGTGLYDNLQKYKIPDPTSIFDLDYFHYDPKPFFTLAKELYPTGKYKPCLPHYFAKLLHDKGLLLRMYTQNIDGLERIAGIPSEKLVEAHGTFTTASCTKCGKKHNGVEIKKKVLDGITPRCNSSGLCQGIVKPDIVFFGEDLPRRFYYYLKDFPSCDLLIIMGTSLEVEPFAGLTASVRSYCPRVLLNRELVGPFKGKSQRRTQDLGVTGDLTEIIKRLADILGWKDDLEAQLGSVKFDEEIEIPSDVSSTDSGILSSDSAVDSTRRGSQSLLPPVDRNIKRYFHTIRSTPPPKFNSFYVSNSAKPPSYYDYIKGNLSQSKTSSSGTYNKPLTIKYAKTVPGKASSCKSIRTFGVRYNNSDTNSSISDVSSDEEASSDSSSSTESSS